MLMGICLEVRSNIYVLTQTSCVIERHQQFFALSFRNELDVCQFLFPIPDNAEDCLFEVRSNSVNKFPPIGFQIIAELEPEFFSGDNDNTKLVMCLLENVN